MKNIKKQIAQCMSDLEIKENGTPNARFVFPEDFIGFQGHFPGNRVLPGVCQIQCLITMLEKWKNKSVSLKEIILAKFLSPVLPLEELTCTYNSIEKDNGDFVVKASFNKDNKRITEMKLKVQFRG